MIRILAFYAGLLVVLVAMESPIDRLADRYFWVHMLQHELLLMVAPPAGAARQALSGRMAYGFAAEATAGGANARHEHSLPGRVASSRRLANSSGGLDHVHGQLLSLARALRV